MTNLLLALLLSLTAHAKVLYIVGMETEAQLVRASNTDVLVGGGNATELTDLLAHVDRHRYSSVIHFGIVGGISPRLGIAEVVLPTLVVTPDNQSWHPSPGILREFANHMRKCGVPFRTVVMTGSAEPVGSVAERAELWHATGANIVDTQIQVSAAWATENGLPFAALGALSDDWQTNLPPAALIPLTPQGTPDIGKIILSVLAGPWQIPALVDLARTSNAALANLRRVIDCGPSP